MALEDQGHKATILLITEQCLDQTELLIQVATREDRAEQVKAADLRLLLKEKATHLLQDLLLLLQVVAAEVVVAAVAAVEEVVQHVVEAEAKFHL